MRITTLLWDDDTTEHLAEHGVHPAEADQACRFRPYMLRARGGRYIVLGQTDAGRFLTLIVAPLGGGRMKLITARAMTEQERHRYLKR